MTHLSSTLSDPLSQFQQFNWSLNLFSESDTPQTSKTAGSSALQSLTYSENEPVTLSPIGSQCYSNPSSLSTKSSNDSSAPVGGSAQLRQLSLSGPNERSAEAVAEAEAARDQGTSGMPGPVSHAPALDSVQKTLIRSSPRVFPRHRNSTTSQSNLPSSLSAPSSNVGKPSSTLSRANSIASSSAAQSQEHQPHPLPRSPTTLWMGDLESWMDEDYVRRCLMMTGLNLPHFVTTSPSGAKNDVGPNGVNVKIKMISGASPSSAYCFLTYPTAEMAEHAWRIISSMPPTLMPGCERTFKLNWATGLPGVQPTWDREFSVFIRDLDRDVSEGELVALFTCSFPSTKSAKIMGDLSTGLSRGYAFIRFGEESDMHRALALGRSKTGTGLFLRGRCIKIAEASGSSGTAGDHSHHRGSSILPSGGAKSRSDHSSVTPVTNRQDDYAENRFHPMSNSRMMVNSAQDTSKPVLRSSRDGLHHIVAGGLSSSTSSIRSSSSYPPVTTGIAPTSMPQNSLTNDPLTANYRFNRDGLSQIVAGGLSSTSSIRSSSSYPPVTTGIAPTRMPPNSMTNDPLTTNYRSNRDVLSQPLQPMGQLSSSMSALRLSHSYPSNGAATKSAQVHLVPAIPTTFGRAFPTCTPIMEPNQLIMTANLPTHYPQTLSHPPCGAMASPNSISSHLAALTQIASVANDASNDPSNTTVFVGGLPACISEGTLKNFGEITYVKIPPNKGCGFVQYARREDAQQAMLKMHDFPIHGKSRIRLSWGRSLGDKQVEYVKKLSSALGISFESVWKIVQGQDPSMIKQIASTLSTVNASLPAPTPTARQSVSAVREPEQQTLPSPIHAVMPGMSRQSSYLHHLPNGQSIPISNETFSPPLPSAGHRGSWQGFLPTTKSITPSLDQSHPIGGPDFPVGLRGCRTPSFSCESIPSTQANALRLFDKTWGFPL